MGDTSTGKGAAFDVEDVLSKLDVDEKIALLSGKPSPVMMNQTQPLPQVATFGILFPFIDLVCRPYGCLTAPMAFEEPGSLTAYRQHAYLVVRSCCQAKLFD